eukprot:CAMPEP_0172329448 /NCGR_PEP_ID=MMETSP1058-20130122/60886_1 /TAXON_ID=83371 /ORGANISM="Detonula confervacea, Strain CCMP 353" /LENGTH=204 /DNA_ID=CAMNT_0013046621 /DNA_START=1164 /DNA_END=1778 /DNA_ORIENTATION=+
MKSISAPLLLLVALVNIPSSVHAISFTASTATCDGDPFKDLNLTVACNNVNSCGFGDTAVIGGTVEATSVFSSDTAMTLRACIMSYCPDDYARNAGNLCDWLKPTGNQECGEVGYYSIENEQAIPEAPNGLAASYAWAVKVKIGVDDADCETGGTSYQMTYSIAGLASLVMGAAALAARKKRRADANDDEKATRFLQMGDVAVV